MLLLNETHKSAKESFICFYFLALSLFQEKSKTNLYMIHFLVVIVVVVVLFFSYQNVEHSIDRERKKMELIKRVNLWAWINFYNIKCMDVSNSV